MRGVQTNTFYDHPPFPPLRSKSSLLYSLGNFPRQRNYKKLEKTEKWKNKVSVDYYNKYVIDLESFVRNVQPLAEPWFNQQSEMQIAVLEMTVRKPSFDNFNNADTEYTAAYLGLIFLDQSWPDATTSK